MFFACSGETATQGKPYLLNLHDADADEFERKLQDLCRY